MRPSLYQVLFSPAFTHPTQALGCLHLSLEDALGGLVPTLRWSRNHHPDAMPPEAATAFEQALAREEYETALALHNRWRPADARYVVEMRWAEADRRYVSMTCWPRPDAEEAAARLGAEPTRERDTLGEPLTFKAEARLADALGLDLVVLSADSPLDAEPGVPVLRSYVLRAHAITHYTCTVEAASPAAALAAAPASRAWDHDQPELGDIFGVEDEETGQTWAVPLKPEVSKTEPAAEASDDGLMSFVVYADAEGSYATTVRAKTFQEAYDLAETQGGWESDDTGPGRTYRIYNEDTGHEKEYC